MIEYQSEERYVIMENCMVRLARMGDYESVENIMKQVQNLHIEWRPDIYKPCDVVLSYEEFLEAIGTETLLVADLEDKVVGILLFLYRHVGSDKQVKRDVLFIEAMAVDESHRGKGVGHKLFDEVKKIAKQKKVDRIELQVNARNIRAKAMYESYGFTEKSINMELL